MKKFVTHLRLYVFRGLLALIPIGMTIFAIRIIYIFIDKRVMELIDRYIGYRIPGVGLLLFVVFLYFTGMIASNVLGKKLFSILENIMTRIPLIKTIYQVGKQLSNTLSLPEKQIFTRAVLVDYFRTNSWIIGFVTGIVINERGEKILKVFVPSVPNAATGFLTFVREGQVIDPQWTIEEAMKMVISGGIIGPADVHNIK